MKQAWYTKKWVIIFFHVAAWTVLFSLPTLLRPTYNNAADKHPQPDNDWINFWLSRINEVFLVAFFYLNAIVLIPKLAYKKLFIGYILSLAACYGIIITQSWYLRQNFLKFDPNFTIQKHLFFNFFIFLFILACSITYRLLRDKFIADNLAKEKENEFLKTELSLLRSQVSPHFMFNVLNNMVALARKQSDQLEPSLIKLSSLMRYMLYETDEEKVTLEKEAEYLQSYIDLQRQRFGKKVLIDVNIHQADSGYFIEPMLLIPFVENAFKHGTGMIENPTITIDLKGQMNVLYFKVQNKFNNNSNEIKDKASGIGLVNVQRRLNILYKDKHELFITKNDGTFTVNLQIQLS